MVEEKSISEGRSRDVRAALIDAFEGLLQEHPLEAISVRDITVAAGVSNPTLYYHFGTKGAFYRELITDRVSAVARAVAAAHETSQSLPSTAALSALARVFTRSVSDLPAPTALLNELLGTRHTEVRRVVLRAEREIREYFEAAVLRGVEAGEIRSDLDPRTVAIGIVGTLSLFAARSLVTPSDRGEDDPLRFVLEVVIPGLIPDGGRV